MEVADPTNDEHGTPDEGMECMATMEDITEEDKNYCEYQTMPSGRWHKSLYSSGVVRRLILTQFSEFLAGVQKADCEADLKRRLAKGPPVWVEDKHALPIPEDDTHICRIWLAEDGKEYSAKLKDCVEVRARAVPRVARPSSRHGSRRAHACACTPSAARRKRGRETSATSFGRSSGASLCLAKSRPTTKRRRPRT